MKAIRRLLRRLGIMPYKPYVCRVCGYVVPLRGLRYSQAAIALNHWQENHEEPRGVTTGGDDA